MFPVSALRVLFVIPGAAQGNSMIFARRQAASLRDAGVEVNLFHLRSRTSLVQVAREWVRFRRRVRRIHPHVVHAHFGTVTAMFAALAAPGLPLVITFRGGDLNPASRRATGREKTRAFLGRVLSQLAALRAARMICVSGQLRERLWWRRRNAVVLPSGVDQEVFAPEPQARARGRLGWGASERVVLFNAGRDARIKRLDLARQAVELARPLVAGLRLEVLDGGTPPEGVPALMNAADCLLLTSDWEGSPTVIQEALACNLPVVSVDVGDTVERLRGVDRARIVPRDPEAIARALVEMLSASDRGDGRRKLGEFSAGRIAGELYRVYFELTGRRSARIAEGAS
jgi:teichuronic acid biosynthesis glycosyltransferase TuaC